MLLLSYDRVRQSIPTCWSISIVAHTTSLYIGVSLRDISHTSDGAFKANAPDATLSVDYVVTSTRILS